MVDTQKVEDGGVQIVHVHLVARDIVADIIRLAVHRSALDTAAGERKGISFSFKYFNE